MGLVALRFPPFFHLAADTRLSFSIQGFAILFFFFFMFFSPLVFCLQILLAILAPRGGGPVHVNREGIVFSRETLVGYRRGSSMGEGRVCLRWSQIDYVRL